AKGGSTASSPPCRSASAHSSSAWSVCVVSGFITSTCFPASSAAFASGKCENDGVATATRSISGLAISFAGSSVTIGMRYSAPTSVARSYRISQTAWTSLWGCRAKLRTRFGPQYPQPITPTRIDRMVTSLAQEFSSRGPAGIEEHHRDGLEQNLQVQPQRPAAHVFQIELAHLAVRQEIAPGDLPQPGDAG